MVTIKDVAKACNVSIATVSRALRNSGYVSPEKKKLIFEKSSELGYIADNNAQNLKHGKSYTIGIIVSDIENFFYSLVLGKLVNEFKQYGYKTLITYSFENIQIEAENFKMLLSSKVDAIIFTPISNENQNLIDIALSRKIPVLQLYRRAYPEISSLVVDDSYGAYLATCYLLENGCSRIGLLSVNLQYTPYRSEGYIRAYNDRHLTVDHNLIIKYPLGRSVKDNIKEFITTHTPDAIIAGTNTFGIDTLEAMKELNLRLNQDIKLVVFDEIHWLRFLGITTVAQPIDDIYKNCVRMILSGIENPSNNTISNIKVTPKIIIR